MDPAVTQADCTKYHALSASSEPLKMRLLKLTSDWKAFVLYILFSYLDYLGA